LSLLKTSNTHLNYKGLGWRGASVGEGASYRILVVPGFVSFTVPSLLHFISLVNWLYLLLRKIFCVLSMQFLFVITTCKCQTSLLHLFLDFLYFMSAMKYWTSFEVTCIACTMSLEFKFQNVIIVFTFWQFWPSTSTHNLSSVSLTTYCPHWVIVGHLLQCKL
jgi:hypothetical protein